MLGVVGEVVVDVALVVVVEVVVVVVVVVGVEAVVLSAFFFIIILDLVVELTAVDVSVDVFFVFV